MKHSLFYDSATFDLTMADGIKVAGSDFPAALTDPGSELKRVLENPTGSPDSRGDDEARCAPRHDLVEPLRWDHLADAAAERAALPHCR